MFRNPVHKIIKGNHNLHIKYYDNDNFVLMIESENYSISTKLNDLELLNLWWSLPNIITKPNFNLSYEQLAISNNETSLTFEFDQSTRIEFETIIGEIISSRSLGIFSKPMCFIKFNFDYTIGIACNDYDIILNPNEIKILKEYLNNSNFDKSLTIRNLEISDSYLKLTYDRIVVAEFDNDDLVKLKSILDCVNLENKKTYDDITIIKYQNFTKLVKDDNFIVVKNVDKFIDFLKNS